MSFTPFFQYINAQELAEIVKKNDPKEVQVIDVRDDDFVGEIRLMFRPIRTSDFLSGGNIKGAVNSPSESFTQNVTELVRQYEEGEFRRVRRKLLFIYCQYFSAQNRIPCVHRDALIAVPR